MSALRTLAIASASAVIAGTLVALAAQTNYLGTVFIADSTVPSRQLTISASGGITTSVTPVAVATVASTALEACHVLKASAGGLITLTAEIGATSGYLLVFDASSAPADGAVTPIWWREISSNGTNGGLSASWGVSPISATTGITACFSTTGPFTKTASATAAFSAQVQ